MNVNKLKKLYSYSKNILKMDYDPSGFPKRLKDNHPVILGEQYLLFDKIENLKEYELENLYKSLNSLMYIPSKSFKPNGILLRQPQNSGRTNWEIEQHDNYLYMCFISKLGPKFREFSKLFLKYGLTHFFRYDQREVRPKGIKEFFKTMRQPYQISIFEMYSYPLLHLCKVIVAIAGLVFMPSNFKYLLSLLLITDIHLFLTIVVEFFKPMSNTSGKMLLWGLYESRKAGILTRFYGNFYNFFMKLRNKKYDEFIFKTYWASYTKMIKLIKIVNKWVECGHFKIDL